MDFNSLIFPAPKNNTDYEMFGDTLIWLPVYPKSGTSENFRSDRPIPSHLSPLMKIETCAASPFQNSKIFNTFQYSHKLRRPKPASVLFSVQEGDKTSRDEGIALQLNTTKQRAPSTTPKKQEGSCPVLKARINLSKLKMDQERMDIMSNSIKLKMKGSFKSSNAFNLQNNIFKKGAINLKYSFLTK